MEGVTITGGGRDRGGRGEPLQPHQSIHRTPGEGGEEEGGGVGEGGMGTEGGGTNVEKLTEGRVRGAEDT